MALAVTEKAAEALKETLGSVDHEPDQVLRLVPSATDQAELGLALDQTREGDQVVEYEGSAVLVLESSVSESLSASTLDVKEGPEGRRQLTLMK